MTTTRTGPAFSSPAEAADAAAILAGIEPPVADPNARPNRPTSRAGRRALAAERASSRAAGTADKAPKTPRAPGGSAGRTPRAGTSASHVAKSIEALHGMGAAVAPLLGKPQTGELLGATAVDAGKAWAELSLRYPVVAKWLTGGGDAMLIINLALIYMPVLMVATTEARDPAASANMAGLLGAVLGGAGEPAAA